MHSLGFSTVLTYSTINKIYIGICIYVFFSIIHDLINLLSDLIHIYSTAVDMFLSIATRRGVQWSVEKIKFHSVPSIFPR